MPFYGHCTAAIIMNHVFDNKLLINNYIKNIIFETGLNIPIEIYKIILLWCSIEIIYVLYLRNSLWKIGVDDILNSINWC